MMTHDRDAASPEAPASHSSEVRATAVLAVLGGLDRGRVAARHGVPRHLLDRWVATFVEGGRRALAVEDDSDAGAHRDRYLSLVAHELRSPLTMIRGWAEILADAAASDQVDVAERAVEGIVTQTDRLERLAQDVQDASSIALGRLPLELRRMRLADAVRQVVRARAGERPELQIVSDATVAVDPHRLGQVIDNLLENARRHGGRGLATLTVQRCGRVAELVVSSPGAPIPPGLARRLFEPFERGASGGDGVGLGLYVCRSLVAAHGGRIGLRVDDDTNHFWVRLPLVDDAEAPEG